MHHSKSSTVDRYIGQSQAFARLLGVGPAVHEVRVLLEPTGGQKRVVSGRFDNADRVSMELTPFRAAAHCYMTINPLNGSADNTLKGPLTCANDRDISKRRWLLVDIDPIRAVGFSGFCASDDELSRALHVRDEIAAFLEREAGGASVRVRSGNGGTLLYQLDDESRDAGDVKRVLFALAARFDTDGAHIDQTVSNLSRLTRVPGTTNAKASATDRPRRLCTLEHEGGAPPPVSLGALLSCLRADSEASTHTQARVAACGIPTGGRNSALMSIGGSMRRLRMGETVIARALDFVNREACEPPLPAAEVASIATRLGKYEPPAASEDVHAVVVGVHEIVARPVRWLWHRYMPLGKLVIIDGDPGLGKSLLTLDIAARVSRGDAMPDGTSGVSGHVVILSAEDAPEDTIRPRLDAAGADVSRVKLLLGMRAGGQERAPEISESLDLAAIEAVVTSCQAALVIFDPLVAYLGAKTNANHDQEVRRALAPLAQMAERTNATVLGIRHLNKTPGVSAIYRGGGSIAISGAARTVLLVGREPSDPKRRVLAQVKTNLGAAAPSLQFALDASEGEVPRITWLGESKQSADDLVRGELLPNKPVQNEAAQFLFALLSRGPIAVGVAKARATAQGISEATLERAKKALGVRSQKTSMDGGWAWSLPEGPHLSGDEDLRSFGPLPPGERSSNFSALKHRAEADHGAARQQTMIAFTQEADNA